MNPISDETQLLSIRDAVYQLEEGAHPFEAQNEPAIDAGWIKRVAQKPRLFDGEAVLGISHEIRDGVLHARCRKIRYATLLHWLATPPDPARADSYVHIYAWAALISSDGYALMGRMGDHTANAGRIYFPSGSFEPSEFVEGVCDIAGNMRREVKEETGLDLGEARAEPGMLLFSGARTRALIRIYRFDEKAGDLRARIMTYLAQAADDELADIEYFGPGETDPGMPTGAQAFMRQLKG